jgi:hypothetical protein
MKRHFYITLTLSFVTFFNTCSMEITRQSIQSLKVKNYLNNPPLKQLGSCYEKSDDNLKNTIDDCFRQKTKENRLYLLGTIIYLPK